MAFIDQWRTQLPDSLIACRKAIKAAGTAVAGIDPKYGVFAAGLLWPVREAGAEDDQRDAVREICGGKDEAKPLLTALSAWTDYPAAIRELSQASKGNVLLQTALEKVITYFQDALQTADFITIDIHDTTIQGGIVNIGGKQFFYGDVVVQQLQAVMTCPPPPQDPARFGGRDQALSELCEQLKRGETSAITAVYGLGGMGKTTLARKLANVLHHDKTFSAIVWADVTRDPNPLSILQVWGKHGDPSYALPDAQPQQIALQVKGLLEKAIQQACERCEPERVLMVLDDVWDDPAGKGRAAARLLQSAAPTGSTVLITTRSENLAIDLKAKLTALDRMNAEDGLAMLHAYDGFAVLPEDGLRALVIALGGHPLALDLAARRILKGEAGDRAAALSHHTTLYQKGLLAGEAFKDLKLDQGDPREDNLTKVLSYSYDDLSDADRARFRALGTLPPDAPFDRTLLAALWNMTDETLIEACDTLRLFSLMQTAPESGTGWYRQHPLLRGYALALLKQANESEAILAHYADKVTDIAEGFNNLPPEQWNELTLYLPHVHAVGDSLVLTVTAATLNHEVLQRAQRFALNTSRYLFNRREVRHLDWSEMGLTASRVLADQKNAAFFLNNIGSAWYALGEQRKALDFYEQALPLRRAVGDRGGEATTLNNIGLAWDALGEKRKALDYYEQALPLSRAVGDRGGEAAILTNIGWAWDALGEKRKALDYYEQALPLSRAVGDRGGEATTLNNIGGTWDALGEKRKALDYYEQALPLHRAVGDRGGEATTLTNIGLAWSALGEKRKALDYYEQALPLRRAVGDRGGEAATLTNIGGAWDALGEKRKALDYYEQALPLSRAVGDRGGEAVTCFNIGMVYRLLGELDKAIEYVARCVQLDEQIEHPDLASDRQMLDRLKHERDGQPEPPSILPDDMIQTLAGNTVAVKTQAPNKLDEWRADLQSIRADFASEGAGWQIEVVFADALLAVLDDQPAALPDGHQYQSILNQVFDQMGGYQYVQAFGAFNAGEYTKAITIYQDGLRWLRLSGNTVQIARTFHSIGHTLYTMKDYPKALSYFQDAIAIRQTLDDPKGLANTLYKTALLYQALNQLPDGAACLEQSIKLMETHRLGADAASQTLDQHRTLLNDLRSTTSGI